MQKPIDPQIILDAFDMPPEKAVAFLKGKGYAVTWDWKEMIAESHQTAFTIAKVTSLDLLQDVKHMLEGALEDGTTFEQFKKDLAPSLERKGWLHPDDKGKLKPVTKVVTDPATGKEAKVTLASKSRLENIYRTNMQSAYMAGRYKQQKELAKERPYWQFMAVIDDRSSGICTEFDGQIYAADDPFWDSNYPPLHFQCRSSVITLSAAEVERDDLSVSESDGSEREPMKGFDGLPGEWEPDLSKYDKDILDAYKSEVEE